MLKHISYSAIKDYSFCPHYFRLTRIDRVYKFAGNIHTAFGSAVHSTIEGKLLYDNNYQNKKYDEDYNTKKEFIKNFKGEITSLQKEDIDKITKKDISDMTVQGSELSSLAIDALGEKFGKYELIAVEEELTEPLEKYKSYDFKGFIDIVIKTEDGIVHVIDWKTCSWGWDARRKADSMTGYQLAYYKHFYANKYNIDPKKIETHFALLKRTAKKDKAEIFRITTGKVKVDNAMNLLDKVMKNVERGRFFKNLTQCENCVLRKKNICV